MNRDASSPMGRNANENADRGTYKKVGSGASAATSAIVVPDEFSEESLKLATEA